MINWTAPEIKNLDSIPKGDMPGDKIQINEAHLAKARLILPELLELLQPILGAGPAAKAVVAVHGGSGVGKSEIGALLAFYLNQLNIGCYVLSGDNYPRRIPRVNDQERLRIYRETALKGLVGAGEYTPERNAQIKTLQREDRDFDPAAIADHPWLATYQASGREGLKGYLGTSREIDFAELSAIIARFRQGEPSLWLKRMGREEQELWYDNVDVSKIQVLLIEWTHGNNPELAGVDVPILLNSTPQETLAHRQARNRDGGADSPFTTMVLAIEQAKLFSQAARARLIMTKSGEIVSYERFLELMKTE